MLLTVAGVGLYNSDTLGDHYNETLGEHSTESFADLANFRDYAQLRDPPLTLDFSANGRSTLEFVVFDEDSEYEWEEGDQVEVMDLDGELVFAGIIQSVRKKLSTQTIPRTISITAVDYTTIWEWRRVSISQDNIKCGDVFTLLLAELAEDGFVAGTIQDGETIPEVRIKYGTAYEVAEALAEYSGFIWIVEADKTCHFVDPTTWPAPWTLEYEDTLFQSLDVELSNPSYYNRAIVAGGLGKTTARTESFKGDGTTQNFPLSFPVAEVPTSITVNGVTKTIGIKTIDTDKDWYWSLGDNIIEQDSDGTKLTSSDTLAVTYSGQYEIINSATDYEEVAARATRTGTSGLVEAMVDGSGITDEASALILAQSKLAMYAVPGIKASLKTRRAGLAAGQMLTFNRPDVDLDGVDLLITRIKITDILNNTEYDVEACQGPVDEIWETIFGSVSKAALTGKIEIGDVSLTDVLTLKQFSKTWLETDSPNPFSEIYAIDTSLPGDALIPCFAVDERFRYVVVYRAGAEIFRKAVSSVSTSGDDTIVVCYITADEAVGAISHIGLWGGSGCSAIAGSGIELDKQACSMTKTDTEGLQIVFTETRW